MSQSVSLWGATYSDVPAIEVPKSGGGMASFTDVTDTTAAASDVATGKYFYTAAGVRTQGTNSGGGSVTQDQDGFIVLPSTGGGSASKIVSGTFTASSTTGAAQTISVPYSGNGYPISCFVYPTNGLNDPLVFSLIQQYVISVVCINKTYITSTVPTYSTSGSQNQGQVIVQYKNTNTVSTSYGIGIREDANTYSSDSATDSSRSHVVRFTSNTTLSVFIASSSYGLIPGVEYTYIIEYSE